MSLGIRTLLQVMIARILILLYLSCGLVYSFQTKFGLKNKKITKLFVESVDSKTLDENSSNNVIGDDGQIKSISAPRVYKPKTQLQPLGEARIGSNSALVLVNPHFLIRYRSPKTKSSLKTQLEELQVRFKQVFFYELNSFCHSFVFSIRRFTVVMIAEAETTFLEDQGDEGAELMKTSLNSTLEQIYNHLRKEKEKLPLKKIEKVEMKMVLVRNRMKTDALKWIQWLMSWTTIPPRKEVMMKITMVTKREAA